VSAASSRTQRTLILDCADWPVTAAGAPLDQPSAVVHANRVVAVSRSARMQGVIPGLRRREAQSRCPALQVIAHDPARDARQFDAVVGALGGVAPRVEVLAPGLVAIATLGPSRYWGGDQALAERVAMCAATVVGDRSLATAAPAVGVADSRFAARLAARQAIDQPVPVAIVPSGMTRAFLGPFPVATIGLPDLADLFRRLGLRSLADVAALERADLLARFGLLGDVVHRWAVGEDDHPIDPHDPPVDWTVEQEFEPPVDRVDQVTFAAKALADRLLDALADRGLVCVCAHIEVHGTDGELLERWWRHDRPFTAGTITERVRWQLEGWLRTGELRGVASVRIHPEQVVADRGRQLGFWGWSSETDERAIRGLGRLSALVGSGRVHVPDLRGGRQLTDQVALVPLDAVDLGDRVERSLLAPPTGPWPGRLPTPSPSVLHDPALPAQVEGAEPGAVQVSGRGVLSQAITRVAIDGGPWREVLAWAGPWCIEERWWDATRMRRQARFQVLLAGGIAHVLTVTQGRWWIEASYH
jgi:protein ImuB